MRTNLWSQSCWWIELLNRTREYQSQACFINIVFTLLNNEWPWRLWLFDKDLKNAIEFPWRFKNFQSIPDISRFSMSVGTSALPDAEREPVMMNKAFPNLPWGGCSCLALTCCRRRAWGCDIHDRWFPQQRLETHGGILFIWITHETSEQQCIQQVLQCRKSSTLG